MYVFFFFSIFFLNFYKFHLFSKNSLNTPDPMAEQRKKSCGYVLISADFNGAIKVFINKTKPKHSSLPYTAILD